jgi:hypothetical protein
LTSWQRKCIEQADALRATGCEVCGEKYGHEFQFKESQSLHVRVLSFLSGIRKRPVLVFLTYILLLLGYMSTEGIYSPVATTVLSVLYVRVIVYGEDGFGIRAAA